MKTKSSRLFLAVCLGFLTGAMIANITGCAGDRYNRSTGENIDDESVQMRVNSALHGNADYKFDGVEVTVFKGTVQLSGFVDLSAQKSKAEDLAGQVQGAKKIVNNITVKDQSDSANGGSSDDKSLEKSVRSALADNPDYKFSEVNVDVYRGTVQLSGFVDTSDQKSKAADIAGQVLGVKDVVNNITVKP